MKLKELYQMAPTKDWISPAEFQELVEDHKALRGKVMMMFEALRRKSIIDQGDIDEAGEAMEKEFYEALGASQASGGSGRPKRTSPKASTKQGRKAKSSAIGPPPLHGILRGRKAARKASTSK